MPKEVLKIETGRRKEIIDTSGSDAKEWRESQVRYGQLKGDLETQIGLIIGFGGLREKPNGSTEDKNRNARFIALHRRGVDR